MNKSHSQTIKSGLFQIQANLVSSNHKGLGFLTVTIWIVQTITLYGNIENKRLSAHNEQILLSLSDFFLYCMNWLSISFTISEIVFCKCCQFNPIPDDKILDWSKLKQIADDFLKCI